MARTKFQEMLKYGPENVTDIDTGMGLTEMEDTLATLMAEQEEVSLDEALAEFEGEA